MWDEGIQMARTAYALDAAIEIGDSRRVKEMARILSEQVKTEVSAQAEAGGWYEEYDRLTDMDAGLDKPVREWYAAMYPNDASVADIRPGMTFRDMLDEAIPYGDLAGEIIDRPPVVRDRVLDEISVRSGVPYAQVAVAWRDSHPEQPGGAATWTLRRETRARRGMPSTAPPSGPVATSGRGDAPPMLIYPICRVH